MIQHPESARAKWQNTIIIVCLGLGGLALLLAIIKSLNWRYVHDSPLMIYSAFLIDRGAVPYRDFFDMNMPGTYAVMWFMGKTLGWSDLAFRVFDLICLVLLGLVTFRWLKPLGIYAAISAPLLFSIYYIEIGPVTSLQREYIALIPLVLMLSIVMGDTPRRPWARGSTIGLLIGFTFLIKPQFLILSLPALALFFFGARKNGKIKDLSLSTLTGFLIPVIIAFLYLLITGAWGPFIDMVINYWPLYSHMTGMHEPIAGWDRFVYILIGTSYGLGKYYLPAAILGIMVLSRQESSNRKQWLFIGLLVASVIYPGLSGQFWGYHWIPFHFLAFCAAALAVRPVTAKNRHPAAYLPPIAVLLYLLIIGFWSVDIMLNDEKQADYSSVARVPREMSDYLKKHLRTGDTVQPLDWTGGAVHAMLLAEAQLATRFMYDFHFYHHIDSPYIHKLRRQFIKELRKARPRFVLYVYENRPWPQGENTTGEFPELKMFMEHNYIPVKNGDSYQILETRATAP